MSSMQSRFYEFWRGAARGSKFGAVVGLVIWLILALAGLVAALLVPKLRAEILADLAGESVLEIIGGFLAPIALMALYGAIPGAIIMGIVRMLRANHKEAPESN
jgi:hypothetical protein